MPTARKITDPTNEAQQNGDPVGEPVSAVEVESPNQTNNAEVTALQSEVDRLKGERDQAMERLARLQAEFENARKREARERTDFRDFAVSGAVEQFLPVLDNFRLAMGSGAQRTAGGDGRNTL
jgi:molecular chaperone GrpE